MAATIPEIEPVEITAGDTVKWNKSISNYKASDGWVLNYAINGPKDINIVADADGDNYSIIVAASTTANWNDGNYWWNSYVTKAAERYTIESGRLTIKPDLTQKTGVTDLRTHDEIVLANIRATIEGTATKDIKEYEVAGLRLERRTITELLELESYYRGRTKKNNTIQVHF